MKSHALLPAAAIAAMGLFVGSTPALAQARNTSMVEIWQGTATFEAATSVPVITVHGRSTALEGRARICQDNDRLVIEHLEAVLPIRTLRTGMGLRDEHMRKYVFTAPDGTVPDMRFSADHALCAGPDGPSTICQLSGDLIIRGTSQPFVIALNVKGDGNAFRVVGDGVVKLSAYGIPLPSQLGVTAMDDVKLHLDFVVKRSAERIAKR